MLRLSTISILATTSMFIVIAIGGYVRSLGAGLACGTDWPTCKGYIIPPDILRTHVFLEYIHRVFALLTLILVLIALFISWRYYGERRSLFIWALLTAILLTNQVLLGMLVVVYGLSPLFSGLHLSLATATFGSSVVLSVLAYFHDGGV
jgi:cytochrome c oxidase assembly protein subunit 15